MRKLAFCCARELALDRSDGFAERAWLTPATLLAYLRRWSTIEALLLTAWLLLHASVIDVSTMWAHDCAQPRIPMVEGLEQKLGVSMPDLESPQAKDFLLDLVSAPPCALCLLLPAACAPRCWGVPHRTCRDTAQAFDAHDHRRSPCCAHIMGK